LAEPLAKLSAAIDAKLAGKVQYFSWQRLFSTDKGSLAPPTRRLLIVMPRMDYGDLEPGDAAVQAIHAQAAQLGLDAPMACGSGSPAKCRWPMRNSHRSVKGWG
jgi:hypothetical protein